MLLSATEEYFESHSQPYLAGLYKAIFTAAYYGLLRVGEITSGDHPIRALDVHIGKNKKKFVFILQTLKTHWTDVKPQMIKLQSYPIPGHNYNSYKHCPYTILRDFVEICGPCDSVNEAFFIFPGHILVKPSHMRNTLKKMLMRCGVNPQYYNVHSFRSGRASDFVIYSQIFCGDN